MAELEEKDEFVNTTSGWIGVNYFNAKGEPDAMPLEPGGRIYLSEREQEMTAKAPRDAQDNPFLVKPYERRDPNTGEVLERGMRAPLELVREERPTGSRIGRPLGREQAEPVREEVGAAAPPAAPQPEGEYASGEEVGTPDAPKGALKTALDIKLAKPAEVT